MQHSIGDLVVPAKGTVWGTFSSAKDSVGIIVGIMQPHEIPGSNMQHWSYVANMREHVYYAFFTNAGIMGPLFGAELIGA